MADWILSHAPPHVHYVEPFAGGLQVLLAKNPEGVSEVVNDLNCELTNFWRVLQHPEWFPEFHRIMSAAPFSECEYDRPTDLPWYPGDGVERAAINTACRFFVRCRQSLAGRMKSFTGITKTRTRRGMNNEVSAWLSAVEGLQAVHERLKRVLILDRDALEVIRTQDGPATWFYLDPPYLQETRSSPDVYAHEMTLEQHAKLLDALQNVKGKFALSGYRSGMYERAAAENGWRCVEKEIVNQAAGGKTKRKMVECLWMNY